MKKIACCSEACCVLFRIGYHYEYAEYINNYYYEFEDEFFVHSMRNRQRGDTIRRRVANLYIKYLIN
jgi:hypothetical protein